MTDRAGGVPTGRVRAGDRLRWWRFALLVAVTAVVLVPIASPVVSAVQQTARMGGIAGLLAVLTGASALQWFGTA